MRLRSFLLCALLAPIAAAPQDLPPGVLLVSRIKAHVKSQMAHMPKYTCLETFQRSHTAGGKKAGDTVRLEVLFSGDREYFDSPGGHDFSAENPSAFVDTGLIGNGMFAGYTQALFVNDQGLFTWRGEESLDGRRAVRFDFHVPLLASGYTLTTAGGSALVPWKGSFWADPETLDLIRLEVHADDIPPLLATRDAIDILDYARTRIGDEDVLLPQTGELRMVSTSGQELSDLIEFTHCRSFQADARISFEDAGAEPPGPVAPPPKPRAAPGAATPALPAGLSVPIALDTVVTQGAAVGALLEGRVSANVAFHGKTLVASGAAVRGRIRQLEYHSEMGGYFILGLEFSDIETAAGWTRFFANLETAAPVAGFAWNLTGPSRGVGMQERMSPHLLPGVGTFFMRGRHFEIPNGWKMVWKTQSLN